MNLLTEGFEKKKVIKTNQVVKLTVDGLVSTYPVYQVKLDSLYFNDQNARIATYINQYLSQNNIKEFPKDDIEKYNSIIQGFIEKSNPDKMKDTQGNIELIGQQKYGVVLKDGRIIDGNRRFCCLRNLSKVKEGFDYFETVILDRDIVENAKEIKKLELQIQLGEDEKVDYDPIEKLVGIYRDIEETRLLTKEEYARSVNKKPSQIENELATAKLLVEFLDTINAPGQFYIAREMNLNGPLVDLNRLLKKVKDEDRRQEVKMIVFSTLLVQPVGDMTRYVREVEKIIASPHNNDFLNDAMEEAEEVLDSLPKTGEVTSETVSAFRSDSEKKKEIGKTVEIYSTKAKVTASKNKPNELLEKAIANIRGIDVGVIRKLTEDQLSELKSTFDQLEGVIADLKEALNV